VRGKAGSIPARFTVGGGGRARSLKNKQKTTCIPYFVEYIYTTRKNHATMIKALKKGKPACAGNYSCDGNSVYLHGSQIIKRVGNNFCATLAGWKTPTTRNAINGIGYGLGSFVYVSSKKTRC
jgi:hypothetical protein